MTAIPQIGVGLQLNPNLLSWFPFGTVAVDLLEVLVDTLVGPVDSPYVLRPGAFDELERLRADDVVLLAHSNYGGDFGFEPLENTAVVKRHVPATRRLASPWVANHCFYSENSRADIWSCPLQWSRAELARIAPRARALQAHYGVPLCHENAAYYFPMPGSDLAEAEFLAALVEMAGTYLHLDLHNVYTNARNLAGYRTDAFLAALPLDRVAAIHLAGGSAAGGFYHDWHDSAVPEPVWEMLDEVLRATRVGGVILEYQGQGHDEETRLLGPGPDEEMIYRDLERARALWDRIYGPQSRRSTRPAARGVP